MSKSKSLIDVFSSKYSKLLFFNFHLPLQREKIYNFLTSIEPDRPRIAILRGEHGIGRSYFLDASIYYAQLMRPELKIQMTKLDLGGLEERSDSLIKYADHYFGKYQNSMSHEIIDEMLKVANEIERPNIVDAIQISLLPWLQISVKELRKWLSFKDEIHRAPRRRVREQFHRTIAKLCEDRRLIMHIADTTQLRFPLDRWLRHEIKINPELLVVFSSAHEEFFDHIIRDYDVLELCFVPIERNQIELCMENSFSPNAFPIELYDALWRYSLGYPKELAIKIKDLIEEDLIVQDNKGMWRLINDDIHSQALAEQFSIAFFEPFERSFEGLSEENKAVFLDFLCLVALCGPAAPTNLILSFLGIEEKKMDTFVDMIEERLMYADPPWLIDYEYSHPSFDAFQNTSICGFANSICYQIILRLFSEKERKLYATKFSSYIEKRMPPYTWGAAKLYAELKKHAERPAESEKFHYLLHWWTEQELLTELREELIECMEKGFLEPKILWGVLKNAKELWSPHRLLTLIEAYSSQPDGVPFDMLTEFLIERAVTLLDTGNFTRAIMDIDQLIDSNTWNERLFGYLYHLKGVCETELARYENAIRNLKYALKIREKIFGPEHPNVAETLNAMALVLRNQRKRELEQAKKYLVRALNIHKKTFGPEHPEVATSLNNLGLVLSDLGEWEQAREHYQRALNIRENLLRPGHPKVATSLNNLGLILRNFGELEQAKKYLVRALNINEKTFGPEHPEVAISLNNIGFLLRDLGEWEQAREHYQRALNICEKNLGHDHPNLGIIHNNIGGILLTLGEWEQAREHYQRALNICEKSFGHDHPYTLEVIEGLRRTWNH